MPVETADTAFWERFIEWERDSRMKVGGATFLALSELYSNDICRLPDNYIPRGFTKSVHRAVLSLLARSGGGTGAAGALSNLTPDYVGETAHADLLMADLQADDFAAEVVLGTKHGSWPHDTTAVLWSAPPPDRLALIFEPNTPSSEELALARGAAVSGVVVFIVGGQVDDRVIESVHNALAHAADVIWEPCERHKPPRNLNSQIRGLGGRLAVVVCVTGRVGHSTSGKVKDRCAANGVLLIEVESVAEISQALVDYADAQRVHTLADEESLPPP
jgi:hypothetical protein